VLPLIYAAVRRMSVLAEINRNTHSLTYERIIREAIVERVAKVE
jgi:DNA-binding transcriptional regulator YhcF (GntR family)